MGQAGVEAWTLLYDADCGFCKAIVFAVLAWDRHSRVVPCAIQSAGGDALLGDLDPQQRLASVHLVSPEGDRRSAGAALGPLLALLPGGSVPARGLARTPRLTGGAYGWVAGHRSQLSRAIPATLKRRADARVRQAEADRNS